MQLKVILLELCIKGIKGLLGCQFSETGRGEAEGESGEIQTSTGALKGGEEEEEAGDGTCTWCHRVF